MNNKKNDNIFFNTEAQQHMMESKTEENDNNDYKENSEVLPPLKRNIKGNKKINKFYINIKFPFLKYLILLVFAAGIAVIIYSIPYDKLRDTDDTKYCLVIYDYGDIYSEKILCGSKAPRIDIPVKEDKEFDDWYMENEKYDFNKTVTTNITLVAKYKEE